MSLSKESVKEFQKIFKKVFKEEIDEAEAREKARRLLNLYKVIYGLKNKKINSKGNKSH